MSEQNVIQMGFDFDVKPIVKPKSKTKSESDFVLHFMDLLTAPIIVFESAWKHCIPKKLLNNITMSRMLCQFKGEQMASYTEVVSYIMPRTFESPMHHEWVRIYAWCCLQYANSFGNTDQKKLCEEIAPKNLSDYETGMLNDLRRRIYDKRREAVKQKMKSEKPKLEKPIKPNIVSRQENLFNL